MQDGMLTVARLMQLHLPRASFAFLSACETAKGDRAHLDQTLHLAAAVMFAGFRSVVGTCGEHDCRRARAVLSQADTYLIPRGRSMNDQDGPFVAPCRMCWTTRCAGSAPLALILGDGRCTFIWERDRVQLIGQW